MSLNVFERHNIDRNFDGTGQIVVCITPGKFRLFEASFIDFYVIELGFDAYR